MPAAVSWLMLGVSAAAVFSIATFTLPYVARRVQLGALALQDPGLELPCDLEGRPLH